MWSETVDLRTRPVWDQKICLVLGLGLAHCGLGLGLAVLVLGCERRSCNARRHNDLKGHSSVSSTIYSFSNLPGNLPGAAAPDPWTGTRWGHRAKRTSSPRRSPSCYDEVCSDIIVAICNRPLWRRRHEEPDKIRQDPEHRRSRSSSGSPPPPPRLLITPRPP